MENESSTLAGNVMDAECVEILVKTDYSETPRGAVDVDRVMTSFETLVHTALALEDDPRKEHSYAYSDQRNALYYMDKDHCYAFCGRLAHRKVTNLSLSEENLSSEQKDMTGTDNFTPIILPHYRSNDSALDVTGFDSISEKCHSVENINVKTVDVFSENCILPGVSDPDLSRMTLQGQATTETSSSLPKRLHSNMDHSYSQKLKECFPNITGVKRGRSNDDINLLGENSILKRKDFTKSPFLDHSYQAVELQKFNSNHEHDKSECKNSSDSATQEGAQHVYSESEKNVRLMTSIAFPNQPFLDHTYEEISDSTAECPLTDLIIQTRKASTDRRVPVFTETKANSDHSYVLLHQADDSEGNISDNDLLSDSGTESLNEDNDDVLRNERFVSTCKDHAYVK
ncbi:hypothetical protein ACF0H5_010727 [Mactra antiquata]